MKIVTADPAKNITVFVLDPVESPAERAAISRAILADKGLAAEQVGFVFPPGTSGARTSDGRGLWRLEMAGGEFCGNAARSFALYIARREGRKGKSNIEVSVSGADRPVAVEVYTESGRASAEMPLPRCFGTVPYNGRALSALAFEGITHIIAPDIKAESGTFYAVRAAAETRGDAGSCPALGVLFYDSASGFTRPAVYVRSVDTLVFESSCGSGSAALGAWLCRNLRDGAARYVIEQPGGAIETEVEKKAGELVRVSIGGKVTLGEQEDFFPV